MTCILAQTGCDRCPNSLEKDHRTATPGGHFLGPIKHGGPFQDKFCLGFFFVGYFVGQFFWCCMKRDRGENSGVGDGEDTGPPRKRRRGPLSQKRKSIKKVIAYKKARGDLTGVQVVRGPRYPQKRHFRLSHQGDRHELAPRTNLHKSSRRTGDRKLSTRTRVPQTARNRPSFGPRW